MLHRDNVQQPSIECLGIEFYIRTAQKFGNPLDKWFVPGRMR